MTAEPKTWRECVAAGMALTTAARHLGRSVSAGSVYAKRHGFKFPADPEFAERNRERGRECMRARNADPAYNVLVALTKSQRAEYDLLVRKGGYSRAEALTFVGRADLVRA